jgi:SAM-dependent methyltransferase
MLRFDIINYLISVNDYKSFLEIGTQAKINFTSVNVDRKVCVDPDPNAEADYQMTSDEYFENNFEKFDIVFVDGLHHADVAYRDIVNSLRRLNPGGCIVVHDVIPFSYEAQVIPLLKAAELNIIAWNGDVWKSCVNTDHGCGIIHFTNPGEGDFLDNFQNGYYNYNRDNIMNNLNLISPEEFLKKYCDKLAK